METRIPKSIRGNIRSSTAAGRESHRRPDAIASAGDIEPNVQPSFASELVELATRFLPTGKSMRRVEW